MKQIQKVSVCGLGKLGACIAERFPKADIHTILDAIGSDSRIGQKYLKAGLSFGGRCFPRDNRLLAHTAKQSGVEAPLAEARTR
jgi:UDPglucose 6-dehydrogenase